MRACTCQYACVRACVYLCVRTVLLGSAWFCVCVRAYARVCVGVCMCARVCVVFGFVCVRMFVWVYACMCVIAGF